MMPSSLRSASATMATSSTTPASLWPPPPSSAGQCLMVIQKAETDSILLIYLTILLLCGKNGQCISLCNIYLNVTLVNISGKHAFVFNCNFERNII